MQTPKSYTNESESIYLHNFFFNEIAWFHAVKD